MVYRTFQKTVYIILPHKTNACVFCSNKDTAINEYTARDNRQQMLSCFRSYWTYSGYLDTCGAGNILQFGLYMSCFWSSNDELASQRIIQLAVKCSTTRICRALNTFMLTKRQIRHVCERHEIVRATGVSYNCKVIRHLPASNKNSSSPRSSRPWGFSILRFP